MAKRPRVVASAPSKGGCQTCRIRRVKCDEAKPRCLKCTSTGRTCDGYRCTEVRLENEAHRRVLAPARTPEILSNALTAGLPRTASAYSRQAFQYFVRETAIPLWAISPAKAWVQLAQQLSHQEPVIFNAVAAVGAINSVQIYMFHHSLVSVQALLRQEAAIEQYCKATSSLQRFLRETTVSTARRDKNPDEAQLGMILLCCTLFVTFEILRGQNTIALSHVRHGKSAVRGIIARPTPGKRQPSQDRDLQLSRPISDFLYTLDCMESDARLFDHQEKPDPIVLSCAIDSPQIHTDFSTIAGAKSTLEALILASSNWRAFLLQKAERALMPLDDLAQDDAVRWSAAHALSRAVHIDASIVEQQHELLLAHQDWLKNFQALQKHDGQEALGLIHMQIQHALSLYTLTTSRMTTKAEEELQEPHLANTLDLVGYYLYHVPGTSSVTNRPYYQNSYAMHPEPQRSFSLEHATLPVLLICCTKSCEARTRNRALQLLKDADRREGIHWSRYLAGLADGLVRMQEHWQDELCEAQSSISGASPLPHSSQALDVVFDPLPAMGKTRVVFAWLSGENLGEVHADVYEVSPAPPLQFRMVEQKRYTAF